MRFLYTAGIYAYLLGIKLSAVWNEKARAWLQGRKVQKLQHRPIPKDCIWVHCASVGEFEQGRPIIEWLRANHKDVPLLLTFFSPSGYLMRKDYKEVDAVRYLPPDLPGGMTQFIGDASPRAVIFIKYEIWHNAIRLLHKQQVPMYLVSAKFRTGQIYFSPFGKWFRKSLKYFQHIFSQDPESTALVQGLGITSVSTTGDTRFDRVIKIAQSAEALPELQDFKGEGKLVVAGSTWPVDEQMLVEWFRKRTDPKWKLLLVPHEVNPVHLNQLRQLCPEAVLWSAVHASANSDILIVDTMGLLSRIYHYADIAYVGGGFGTGIHNTLEAAVYGCVVAFGPNHKKFGEALGLIECGAAYTSTSRDGLIKALDKLIADPHAREVAGAAAQAYVKRHAGATGQVVTKLSADLSL